jgi:putative molybdopterin biosynthesis protein
MNKKEVADYLRIKERKVYDLVRTRRIPCSCMTGKWLFPRTLIDLWILRHTEYQGEVQTTWNTPRVIAGSHDLLLAWAIRESECDCAALFDGSLDRVKRLAARQAMASGLHILDPKTNLYNVDLAQQALIGY